MCSQTAPHGRRDARQRSLARPGSRSLCERPLRWLELPPAAVPRSSPWPFLFFAILQADKAANQKEPTTPYTVKLRGAPFNVTEV